MTLALEVTTSLHDGCDCLGERDRRGFEAAVKQAHPDAWRRANRIRPTDDTSYIERRNKIGGNPKAEPNPDAVPVARQRRLSRPERVQHNRRRASWAWADRRTYDAGEDSLVEAFVYGRMTLAQAVKFIEIADEIPANAE
jgi:hypothetical protein